jgi:superfamily II DNA/RNA helicase
MEKTAAILAKLGIQELNEMQKAALAAAKEQKDLVLLSPTGSGKTLAFLLPLLDVLQPEGQKVQALIITPTRELALQIEGVFRSFQTNFKINSVYGGHSIQTEKNNLTEPPAVLVGTPGRLADHLRRERLDLSETGVLVLDEFDKSLEMGFENDMSFIVGKMENLEKRMLISATDLEEIPPFTGVANAKKLSFLQSSKGKLELFTVACAEEEKAETLLELLCNIEYAPTIVFCNHRETVERIGGFLSEAGVRNVVFHGGMEQDERERALIRFRNGSADYLITTDLAARGLDIPEIASVIHYQIPINEDAWIHRNGRTARQSASGKAFVMLTEKNALPEYVNRQPAQFRLLPNSDLPPEPLYETLYFSAGKKDKINKIDLVGFLSKIGGLSKEEIGLVSVLDRTAFVAVAAWKAREVLSVIRDERVKGKKLKIAISR